MVDTISSDKLFVYGLNYHGWKTRPLRLAKNKPELIAVHFMLQTFRIVFRDVALEMSVF